MALPNSALERKRQAIADLEKARGGIRQHYQEASLAVRPTLLVQQSVRKHSLSWLFGSVAAGVVAARLFIPRFKRKKNERDSKPHSSAKSAAQILLTAPLLGFARKMLLSYVTEQLKSRFLNPPPTERTPPPPYP